MTPIDLNMVEGWLDVPERHELATGFAPLAQLAPHLMQDVSTDVYLYKALKEVCGGAYPEYAAQTVGDCESQGHGHGNDVLQAVEIASGDSTKSFAQTFTEFLYGTSRECAGLLGRNGDGSYGSATVKAMVEIGLISRPMMGTEGEYDGARARRWGYYGVPLELRKKAEAYRLGAASLVSTWDELLASLSSGYPVSVSSNQGFTLERDAQGFCRAKGSWGHCMLIAGVRSDRQGALIFQSWGPNTPTGPTVLEMPSFSFWADRQIVERMLAQRDSYALSKSPTFERKPIPARWTYSRAA